MALIVEDGSIVPGANSYASGHDFADYAQARGYDVPATLAQSETYLIMAMDWLESLNFRGLAVDPDHTTKFPRQSIYIDNHPIKSNEIPRKVFYAQLAKAVEIMVGKKEAASGTAQRGQVTREKLGDMEVSYSVVSETTLRRDTPAFAESMTLIRPFLRTGGLMKIRT